MSGENPIPELQHTEFTAYVEMADNPNLPDGAWWAVLEDTCRMFMEKYGIKGDPFEATHQYLRLKYPEIKVKCPNCAVDLDGELIYETFLRQYYGNEEKALEVAQRYGATKIEGRWGRQLGLYSIEQDRTTHYKCPDCEHIWRV